jgi:hypothetical protein
VGEKPPAVGLGGGRAGGSRSPDSRRRPQAAEIARGRHDSRMIRCPPVWRRFAGPVADPSEPQRAS